MEKENDLYDVQANGLGLAEIERPYLRLAVFFARFSKQKIGPDAEDNVQFSYPPLNNNANLLTREPTVLSMLGFVFKNGSPVHKAIHAMFDANRICFVPTRDHHDDLMSNAWLDRMDSLEWSGSRLPCTYMLVSLERASNDESVPPLWMDDYGLPLWSDLQIFKKLEASESGQENPVFMSPTLMLCARGVAT